MKKRIGETFVLNFETAARLTLVVLICNQYTFSDIQKKSAHTLHLLFFFGVGVGWGRGGGGWFRLINLYLRKSIV